MSRSITLAVAAVLVSAPAFADVTVTSQVTGKGLGKVAESESVTVIKGMKMRTDSTAGGTQTTTIIDIEGQRMVTLNHQRKEATVHDLGKLREDVGQTLKPGDVSASIEPNGQTSEIAGRECTGYDFTVSMPMAGPGGNLTMVMTGPVFIAKDSPGSGDFAAFYRAAAERGFLISDPKQAKGAPQQAQGMTQLYKVIADTGGIPYSMDIGLKVEGGGPMATMMNKMMGGTNFKNVVTAVSTDAVSDDRFAIPEGYKVKND